MIQSGLQVILLTHIILLVGDIQCYISCCYLSVIVINIISILHCSQCWWSQNRFCTLLIIICETLECWIMLKQSCVVSNDIFVWLTWHNWCRLMLYKLVWLLVWSFDITSNHYQYLSSTVVTVRSFMLMINYLQRFCSSAYIAYGFWKSLIIHSNRHSDGSTTLSYRLAQYTASIQYLTA